MNGPCVLFADDISLLTSCQNDDNINAKLNSLLSTAVNWMDNHNLEINFTKTKLITFHPHQKSPLKLNFVFNNAKLEQVSEFTLLGLSIDTHINWKSHIQKIRGKLSKFSYALREIKKTTNLQTALVTYYAYAQAWLSYGVMLWGNSTDSQTIFILQKKLIRIITNIEQTDSCKPHFRKHLILTLPCLYILELCKFVRKHPDFYTTCEETQTKYTFRHNKNKINIPQSRLKMHSTSPLVMSIKMYNKLPNDIREVTKTNIFINKLKQFLESKSYYSVKEFLDDKSFAK